MYVVFWWPSIRMDVKRDRHQLSVIGATSSLASWACLSGVLLQLGFCELTNSRSTRFEEGLSSTRVLSVVSVIITLFVLKANDL
jgi:hypothetical protein